MLVRTIFRSQWVLWLLAVGAAAPAQAQAPWVSMPEAPNFDYHVFSGYSPGAPGELVLPAADVAWVTHYLRPMYASQTYLGQTTDNGRTWAEVQVAGSGSGSGIPIQGDYLVDYSALNASACWVLTVDANSSQSPYQTHLARTTSGVRGLAAISTALPPTAQKIHFFTAATGICLAAATAGGSTSLVVYRTTDGGTTWTSTPLALPATGAVTKIAAKYGLGSHLWLTTATGDGLTTATGDVLHTADEGLTWTVAATGLGNKLGGVVFRDALHGLAYPLNTLYGNSPSRQLARTADGGQTWQLLATPWPGNVNSITVQPGTGTYIGCATSYVGPSYVYVGTVATSSDEGNTWQTQLTDDLPYHQLAMSPSGQLWALTEGNKDTNLPMLLRYAGVALASQAAAPPPAARAYPSPTAGLVHLPLAPGETVRVYDALGRRLACPVAANTLDFSAEPAGLYFLTVTSATGTSFTQRLSVVH